MLHLTQLIWFCASLCLLVESNLIVPLPDGFIQGTTYTTDNGKSYYAFQGIPFAAPPVGELRLEAPQPVKPWDGILDASKDAKSCVTASYLYTSSSESEDCLYVNVYVPDVESLEDLPVIVWIYGGAFHSGNNQKTLYGPDFLLEQDVIVVSPNYRLNVFGFLSTGDLNLPGNLGLKDQNLALKWVQRNIAYFGGDPDKVTLMGQSAGGASVGLHLISKKSKDLFRAAIVESGSALNYWSVDWTAPELAFSIANQIPGANFGTDSKALKQFLKNCTLLEIMTAYSAVIGTEIAMFPSLEPESEDAFITESHYDLIENGDFNLVPILIGACAEESLMGLTSVAIAQQVAESCDNNPENLVPVDLFLKDKDNISAVVNDIRNIYINDAEKFAENLAAVAEYVTDNNFTRGVIKQAELSSMYVPVYLYEFSYYGGRIVYQATIPGAEKAGHAAELPYLFNMPDKQSDLELDVLTQNRMAKLWTNFAKYLNPTPEQDELFENLIWPTIRADSLQYLSINRTLEVRPYMKKKSYQKWTEIYETYGSKPFITF